MRITAKTSPVLVLSTDALFSLVSSCVYIFPGVSSVLGTVPW